MTKARMIFGSVHQGGALQHMVSSYPTVPAVLKELIQNSIDVEFGGANKILIEVDFDQGVIGYYDNGPGVDPEFFARAVSTFGHSTKRGDKYGRFGIGLASPLSIAEEFRFTTAPSGMLYQEYEFNRKRLFEVASGGYPIPVTEVRTISHGDQKTPGVRNPRYEPVWWRTAVSMTGLTEDKAKRRLDLGILQADVQSAYGKKLVDLKTKITVKVIEAGKVITEEFKAKLYEGKKLPEWSAVLPDVGRVTVAFHLAPLGYVGSQRIDIGGGDNPSRVPFGKLRLTTLYECLGENAKTALNSKLFQGEVVGEKLQLLASRKGFAQNDALFAFAVALDQWYEDVGRMHFNDEKRVRQENRYQTISLEAIERLKSLTQGQDSPFASLFEQASFGSVGKGHTDRTNSVVPGYEMMGKTKTGEKTQAGEGSSSRSKPEVEKPKHHPGVAIGSDGSERKVVKGHSTGLHIDRGDIGARMWQFNRHALHLTLNDTHPSFRAADVKGDRALSDYQVMVGIAAFRLALIDDELAQEIARDFAEEALRDWVSLVLVK